MDIVTKLTRDKKIPTEADMKRAIKREGMRWRPELGMLLLIKHEARPTTQSTQAFCKRIGLKNTTRIHYWRGQLEWEKKKSGVMKALKDNATTAKVETKAIPQPVPKQLAAAPTATVQEPIASNPYTAVRYRLEEMAGEIKAIGEKYPDLKNHTAAIRAEMGKFIHFTIDREFTDTAPVLHQEVSNDAPAKTTLNGGAKQHSLMHTSSS